MVTQLCCDRVKGGRTNFFSQKFFRFPTSVDLNKCLKHVKVTISFDFCAPFSELPSNIYIYHGFKYDEIHVLKYIGNNKNKTRKYIARRNMSIKL